MSYPDRSLPRSLFRPSSEKKKKEESELPLPSRPKIDGNPPAPVPFVITCPNCGVDILILKVACSIFRHACYKTTGEQINPHTPKHECDRLKKNDLVFGCAKPFRLIVDRKEKNGWKAIECDYI